MKLVHLLPTVFTIGVIVLVLLAAVARALIHYDAANWHMWYMVCLAALSPILLYSLIIFIDSTRKNRSLKVGLLSIPAAFTQLMGYGFGFIESWWKRCVLKKDEFQAFEKTFYK
jgi:UDP-N-acetylmuramyl pentapeptide phosphotransferase/UDP-N-acetylglucosamine-1-phosphate transferase